MVFQRPNRGRLAEPPTDFPLFFQTNLERRLRRRALFFRRGGGAKSEAILTHSIYFGYKKNFCYTEFAQT